MKLFKIYLFTYFLVLLHGPPACFLLLWPALNDCRITLVKQSIVPRHRGCPKTTSSQNQWISYLLLEVYLLRGSSQTTFLDFFDHLYTLSFVDSFYFIKIWHFWTIYQPTSFYKRSMCTTPKLSFESPFPHNVVYG